MDILAKLFSSGTLVKVMRLFLFNPEESFDKEDLVTRAQSTPSAVKYETSLLKDIGFLKPRIFYKTIEKKKGKKKIVTKKKVKGWTLNPKFKYNTPLHNLLISTNLIGNSDILKRLQKVGTLKLVLISGVFIKEPDGRVDLLVVGNKINKSSLARAVKGIEAALGTELYYSALSTDDFEYRVSVRDRLVRDIFEGPHTVILNKLRGLELPSFRASDNA